MGSITLQTDDPFAEIPIPDFINIILKGDERADEAMYYLLRQRFNHQLRQRFEVYQHQLFDEYEDIVDDFFFYLREGKEGNNQQPYQSLESIEKRDALEPWILNTFRNYLSMRAAKEEKYALTELPIEYMAESDVPISLLNDERKLSIASDLIAYAHQVFLPHEGFIFLRTLLTLLNKKQALPNEAVAKALGMSSGNYRVTVHRLKERLARYLTSLIQGEHLVLDDMHQLMAKRINDDFFHLYPTLLGYYCQAIDALPCADAVKQLRQNHYLTTGNMMHEDNDSYSTPLTVTAFWNKLNRFLIV